ncbi:MAG: RNA polymerase sigma factor [Alphaproteobacteria bacterium]
MLLFNSEKSLMNKIAMGDANACRTFVDEYMPMVYRVAIQTVNDNTKAEDITQEVFIKVWEKAESFKGDYKLKTWLYRITVNTSIDLLRKHKVSCDIDNFEFADDTDLSDTTIFKQQSSKQIKQVIEKLKPMERTVITLFYWEELKIKEIAKVMDITTSAVDSMLRRARVKIGKDLNMEELV